MLSGINDFAVKLGERKRKRVWPAAQTASLCRRSLQHVVSVPVSVKRIFFRQNIQGLVDLCMRSASTGKIHGTRLDYDLMVAMNAQTRQGRR